MKTNKYSHQLNKVSYFVEIIICRLVERKEIRGFFSYLLNCGEEKLRSHLDICQKNAVYISSKIQNKIIRLRGEIVKERIIEDCKQIKAYALMTDKTADIAAKE